MTWDKPACLAALADLRPSTESAEKPKGISWDKCCGKWRAVISVAGKRKHIGYFNAHEEATAAYDFVRGALDVCGLSKMDDGCFAVFEVAKSEATEATQLHMQPKGISWVKQYQKWKAQICVAGKRKCIAASFDTPDEAAAAYKIVRKALDECILPAMDGGRLIVYEAAKAKAIETYVATRTKVAEAACSVSGCTKFRQTKNNGMCRKHFLATKESRSIHETQGYSERPDGKLAAKISVNGTTRNIGSFSTSEEASDAYQLVRGSDRKRGRDSAELEASFQDARKKARGE